MPKERLLITVKTYPTLSRKYGETVCTAALRPDGTWVRIYPVPFRRLEDEEQYRKFDWIEADLIKSKSDVRPETRHPADMRQLVPVAHLDTKDKWRERRRIILETAKVHTHLGPLIAGAKANELSLAVFKPTVVKDLIVEEEEPEYDTRKLDEMRNRNAQADLFSEESWRKTFHVIPKLPYSFSYRFADADGRESTLQILDWEIGALYWSCYHRHGRNEKIALEKVRLKYVDDFLTKDLHFFLGTTQQYHQVAPNPWVIIGVFPIPHDLQKSLL
jgi:hypothetical protein